MVLCEMQTLFKALVVSVFISTIIITLTYDVNIVPAVSRYNMDVDPTWCYTQRSASSNTSLASLFVNRSKKIFFIQSQCQHELTLTSRQACAVESAAMLNPSTDIYILFVSPSASRATIVERLLTFPNVHMGQITVDAYFQATSLQNWYWTHQLHRSPFVERHLSDILRLLTLWRYGGTYLDLNTISMQGLEDLPLNYAGAENDEVVGNDILNVDMKGIGHLLVDAQLRNLHWNYRPNELSTNGPYLLSRVLESVCEVNQTSQMTRNQCAGFHVYPPYMFYPIAPDEQKSFFNSKQILWIKERTANAKTIHFRPDGSTLLLCGASRDDTNPLTPLEVIAQQYCPKIYQFCDGYF